MNARTEERNRLHALLKDIYDTKEYSILNMMIASALSYLEDTADAAVSRKRQVLALTY